jgi:hypothetical protein
MSPASGNLSDDIVQFFTVFTKPVCCKAASKCAALAASLLAIVTVSIADFTQSLILMQNFPANVIEAKDSVIAVLLSVQENFWA